MDTKTTTTNDLSMGAVVLGFVPNAALTWHILLINQITEGGGYWGLPKGHPEGAETDSETAIREVNEECGLQLQVSHLIPDLWASENYSFYGTKHGQGPRMRINKEVRYGLAVLKTPGLPSPVIQAEEVTEAIWLPLDKALQRIRHEGQRQVVLNLLQRYFLGVQTHAAMVLQFPVWPILFSQAE